jgi:ribose 5-phosphate isomerase B
MKDNQKRVIAIGCDHAGFVYKQAVKDWILAQGWECIDMGTDSPDSVDYPDFVHPVADAIKMGKAHMGVVMCGSANGVAMAANKHKHIRAAICWTTEIAKLSRTHNDANVLSLPCRFLSEEEAISITASFFTSEFEGGRHQRRVDKISAC